VKILQYSNSWGHLIMSCMLLGIAVFLLLQHDPSLNGVAIGIIIGVQTLWIGGSNAKTSGGTSTPGS
jgi:hypothetical protein